MQCRAGDVMDQLSELYEELLEDQYDCVDRVFLNAYFYSGQYPAGFRTWWRKLCGSDENLDTNHLMRLSGRFSRRVRAFAKERNIPVIDCGAKDHKFEISAEFLKTHTGQPGLFLILVSPRARSGLGSSKNDIGQDCEPHSQSTHAVRQSLFLSYLG